MSKLEIIVIFVFGFGAGFILSMFFAMN